MKLTAPMPFKEALDSHNVRSLLLTSGKARDLAQMEPAVKRGALWSATLALAEPLAKLGAGVEAMLAGQVDQATVRLGLKDLYRELGVVPEAGKEGGLQDLTSTARINLQLETLTDIARGAGWHMQGQDPVLLDEWPAQELVREFGTGTPRGSTNRPGDLSWEERFVKAGGTLVDGRMVALKTDLVWKRLGDPSLFDDGLGNEWAPFAYGSGMGLRDRSRDEAEALGLIEPNQELFPQPIDYATELAQPTEVRDEQVRALLQESGLGSYDAAGVFHFNAEASA